MTVIEFLNVENVPLKLGVALLKLMVSEADKRGISFWRARHARHHDACSTHTFKATSTGRCQSSPSSAVPLLGGPLNVDEKHDVIPPGPTSLSSESMIFVGSGPHSCIILSPCISLPDPPSFMYRYSYEPMYPKAFSQLSAALRWDSPVAYCKAQEFVRQGLIPSLTCVGYSVLFPTLST